MNPYRIYRDEWARALAVQTTALAYTTFVAMPFQEWFSYRSREILRAVFVAAVSEANRRGATPRPFAAPGRVDTPMGAAAITEEIVLRILESHFFLADVTFQNPGVLLETGVALGTKPNQQIVLVTQGSLSDLHFDLRNNNVIRYSPKGSVDEIADALVAAARHFEEQVQHHILAVTRRLSPEAILALNWYGQLQRNNVAASLHAGNLGPFFEGADGRHRFDAATHELRERDLLWTDYAVGAVPGGDAYGMHATELGWAVIGNMWAVLRRPTRATAADERPPRAKEHRRGSRKAPIVRAKSRRGGARR